MTSLALLLVAFAYAIVRYHVFRGTPWADFPLFINNKAISLASVFFLALSYMTGPLMRFVPSRAEPFLSLRKFFGLMGFGLGALHACISLLLFSPAHYPRFFAEDGALNFIGQLSMLFGVLAFAVFFVVALSSVPSIAASLSRAQWQAVQRAGYGGVLLVLLHVVTMGYRGWGDPSRWPGFLLPISLVAAIVLAVCLLLRVIVVLSPGSYGRKSS